MDDITTYVTKQGDLAKIVNHLAEQLKNLESHQSLNQTIDEQQFKHFKSPVKEVVISEGGPLTSTATNFQIKADLDLGKFSGSDPTPDDELTFGQWYADVKAYQNDYPSVVLLPAVRKSIIGKAKSVVRSLGSHYMIDYVIGVLAKEYEGVASSDVIFKEFYQMQQEKNEKVQVFSVRIREALDRLTVRFPGRIQPHEEDKTLCDRLFYGMKGELKNGVRHMYDNPKITFSELLNKARKVELEDTELKILQECRLKEP